MQALNLKPMPITLPPEVEVFWANFLKTADFEKVESTIQVLSDGFTKERSQGFVDYTDTQIGQLAYGLFFFPRTWAMCRFPLNEIIQFRRWLPALDAKTPFQILDLGCGTGAASLSAAHGLRQAGLSNQIEIHAVDHSRGALKQMEALLEAGSNQHFANCSLKTEVRELLNFPPQLKQAHYHLILCSFALNELSASQREFDPVKWLANLKPSLREGGLVLVIEPALRATARQLQATADHLIHENTYHNWGPYLHDGPCPMLKGERFWNHECRRWTPPNSLELLNRKLWRSVSELKFSYTALGLNSAPAVHPSFPKGPQTCRLTSPISQKKGFLLWSGVGTDGAVHVYELQTRGMKKAEIKNLGKIERGTLLNFSALQAIGDPPRQRLPDANTLKILHQ